MLGFWTLLLPWAAQASCFTSGGPQNGVLNVHIVPHSHDDVGWLKTPDEYYYGANNSIQHAGVQYIYDSVIPSLLANKDRKFSCVEQAFFQRWWQEQDESMQNTVRELHRSGQFVFINGGFTQHDEANPYFVSMVDQTTLGHRFLLREFGAVPTVAWQIDPFGHSSTHASLLSAAAGFDALYFARLDYQERDKRRDDRTMEMIWEPGAATGMGEEGAVFTGAFVGGGYGPPDNLCFDVRCDDEPVMDDDCLEDENAARKVNVAVTAARLWSNWTLGNNVLFLMGSDFNYENANLWYKNLDKLIHWVKKDGRINMFYSTPEIYTMAKHNESLTWPTRTGDFFPICQEATEDSGRKGHSYWAGFFTSRALLKYYIRSLSAYLHAAQQLQIMQSPTSPLTPFSRLGLRKQLRDHEAYHACRHQNNNAGNCGSSVPPFWVHWLPKRLRFDNALNGSESSGSELGVSDLLPLSLVLAESTHHDSITGTSKQHVAYDNARRLSVGQALAEEVVNDALRTLLKLSPTSRVQQCQLLNESICEVTQDYSAALKPFRCIVYNPLAQARNETVRVPLSSPGASVVDLAGHPVDSFLDPQGVLMFAVSVSPLSASSVIVYPKSSASSPQDPPPLGATITIENQYLQVVFSSDTGRLLQMTNLEQGVITKVDQGLYWYQGDPTPGKGAGAYMFRPINANANGTNISCVGDCTASISVVRSNTVQIVTQRFADWAIQEFRLYANSRDLDLQWTIGPVPIDDGKGKEIVSRWTTDIRTKELWYTDSNGREMLERRRNYRAYFKLNLTEPQAANYYPFGAAASIKDTQAQLTIQADRAQGATSLIDGQLEVLVMRRLLYDDGEGVGEPLNETLDIEYAPDHNPHRLGPGITVIGTHRVSLTSPQLAARAFRINQERMWAPVVLAFSDDVQPSPQPAAKPGIPPNVFLMTTEATDNSTILVRVAHKYGVGEDSQYSVPVNVSLTDVASLLGVRVVSIKEVSLTANRDIGPGARPRLQWKYNPSMSHKAFPRVEGILPLVTLNPLQIRTFVFGF